MAEYALNSFIGGEVSQRFAGRTDLMQVRNGCETLKNMIVLPEGSILKTPGLLFYKSYPNLDPTKSRLLAVKRSTGESYLIEMYPSGGIVIFEVHTEDDSDTSEPFFAETTDVDVSTELITLALQAYNSGILVEDDIELVGSGDSTSLLDWGDLTPTRNGTPISLEVGYTGDSIKIVADDAAAGDEFGCSVSVSGDYVAVGAEGESSNRGAVYIFHRTGEDTWDTGTKIVAYDAGASQNFGGAVSISGDYVIVGARHDFDEGIDAGAAYIFHRTGINTWDTGTKITAPDAAAGDDFGSSVSISGDYAIVSAPGEATGGSDSGAAYIFHRTGTNTWDTGTKIVASDAAADDNFGYSVAISGDYAIVGANEEDAGGSNAGAAYVFNRTDTNTWDAGTKIVASDAGAGDYFGCSVSISGDYAVVGAQAENTYGTLAGAAYVFHRTDTNTWDTGTKIVGQDVDASDRFGYGVSIDGDWVVVGAPGKTGSGGMASAGVVYVFRRTGTNTWDDGFKVENSTADNATDWFGASVGISGRYIVGGIKNDDDSGTSSGSALICSPDGSLPGSLVEDTVYYAHVTSSGITLHEDGDDSITGDNPISLDPVANAEYYATFYDYTVDMPEDSWEDGDGFIITGIVPEIDSYGIVEDGDDSTASLLWGSFWDRRNGSLVKFKKGYSTEADEIVASDAFANDKFGATVGIDGDYMISGSYGDDDDGSGSGSAYIYLRSGDNEWGDETKLTSPSPVAGENFGRSVAISGNYVIVGAHAPGISTGAAYIFHRTGENTWDSGTQIVAPDAATGDEFGFSVSIDGDYAIVGAHKESEGGTLAGAAYIFHRTGANIWDSGTKIVADNAGASDQFGCSVSISGDYAIVGAKAEDTGGTDAGAAYIFHRTGANTWDTGTMVVASDAGVSDNFGFSVGISGDYAIVGAFYETSGTGAAYIFNRTGTNTWDAGVKVTASDAAAGDEFGISVAIRGEMAIVGAHKEDGDGLSTAAGAAYIFHRLGTNTWDTGIKVVATTRAQNDNFGCSVAIEDTYAVCGAYQKAGYGEAFTFGRIGSLPGSLEEDTAYYAYQVDDNGDSTYDISIHSTAKDGLNGTNALSLSPVADTDYYVTLHTDLPDELDPGTPYYLAADGDNAELYPTRANAIAGTSQITISGEEANFECMIIPLSANKTISTIDEDDLPDMWFTQWSETTTYMTKDGQNMRRFVIEDLNDLSFSDVAGVGGEQIAVSTYQSFNTVNATEDRIYFLLDDLPQLPAGTPFTAKGTWPSTCLTVDTVYYLGSADTWEVGTEEQAEIIGVSYKVYASESNAILESSAIALSDQSNGSAELSFGSTVSAPPETPAVAATYESRLIAGGGTEYPDMLFGSMVGEPERFHKLSVMASHGWEHPVAGAEYDTIRWVAGGNALLVATKNSVYKMGGENDLITPLTTPITRPQSSTGAAAIPPVFFEDFIVYVGEGGKRIYALTYSDDVAKYGAMELSVFSEHLFDSGVKRIEMQRSPYPILWVLLNDGTLVSMVYHKATQVIAWSQHDFDVEINDICVLDSTDGNDPLYIQGSFNGYHVLGKLRIEESDDLYIDSINNRYISTSPTTSVSLPKPYWSQTVHLVIDGVDKGEVSIPSDGDYDIPSEWQGGTQYVFGTVLSPVIKTNPVVDSLMSKKRISEVMVKYTDTSSFKIGRDSDTLETVTLTDHEDGHKIIQVAGGWDTGQVYITKEDFGSMLITAVISEVDRA